MPKKDRAAVVMGRPTKYDPKIHPAWIRSLARYGATMGQIAEAIGIGVSTLYSWNAGFPKVAKALRAGREISNAQLEDSLFKRALGYTFDAPEEQITTEAVVDDKGNPVLHAETKRPIGNVKKVEKKRRVHIPADVEAAEFLLCNRDPARYRRKTEVAISGDLTVNPQEIRAAVGSVLANPESLAMAKRLMNQVRLPTAPADGNDVANN